MINVTINTIALSISETRKHTLLIFVIFSSVCKRYNSPWETPTSFPL